MSIAVASCLVAPGSAHAQRLFVATKHASTVVDVVDGRGGGARAAITLPARRMTVDQAIARQAAYPIWVEDPTADLWELEEQRARGETISASSWPELLAVGGGSLFAVVGDEEPGFVAAVPLDGRGPPRYFDVLARHPLAAVATGDKLFVSYLNRGVWAIDPRGGATAIARVDGLPDACTALARSRDGGTLFVAGRTDDDEPAVFAVDAAKARVARVLRLPAPVGGDHGGGIEAIGVTDAGTLWVVTVDGARRALSVHLADAGARRFRPPVLVRATAGLHDGREPAVIVAGQTLFALTDTGLDSFALARPDRGAGDRARAQTTALPEHASGIWAAPDGARIFVTLPDACALLPLVVGAGGRVTREPLIALDGELGAVAIEAAVR